MSHANNVKPAITSNPNKARIISHETNLSNIETCAKKILDTLNDHSAYKLVEPTGKDACLGAIITFSHSDETQVYTATNALHYAFDALNKKEKETYEPVDIYRAKLDANRHLITFTFNNNSSTEFIPEIIKYVNQNKTQLNTFIR